MLTACCPAAWHHWPVKRRLGFLAVWLSATLFTGWVAWAAVGFVDSQVGTTPAAPLSSSEVAYLPLTTPTAVPSTVDVPEPSIPETSMPDITEPSSTTTSTEPASTSTTSTPPTSSPPPSTSPPTTHPPRSSTTTVPSGPTIEVHNTPGGTVTIAWTPGKVWLVSVSPAGGFTYDVEHDGPEDVKVEFEKGETEVKFHASWEDGELRIKID